MISSFGIGNPGMILPALIGGAALLALLLIKEWADRDLGALWSRILAAGISVASLVLIALEPVMETEREGRLGILLTEGFRQGQADSLKKAHPGIRTFDYKAGQPLQVPGEVKTLYILGYGPQGYDHWQFAGHRCHFLGASPPAGIMGIQYRKTLGLGGDLSVRGLYSNAPDSTRLLLLDPGGNPADSVLLAGEGVSEFQLRGVPKAAGDYVFTLEARDPRGEVLSAEPLPVRIRTGNPLRLLILNTYPTFETKYLKNFLAGRGNALLVRSQLTRGRYKFEYFNREATPVYRFSDKILSDFDAVIADWPSLQNLDPASLRAIEKRVAESGLGLFIQPDEDYFRQNPGRAYFEFSAGPGESANPGEDGELERYPYFLSGPFTAREVQNPGSGPIGVVRPLGAGRVATTWLRETYPLVLDGKEAAYAQIWTTLLDAVVTAKGEALEWEALTGIPRVDEPFEFRVRTGITDPEVRNSREARIPLIREVLLPGNWQGRDYPRETGWNRLRAGPDSLPTHTYFVYDEKAWESVEAHQLLQANRRAFSDAEDVSPLVKQKEPVPPIWFFAAFLLGMGWLWLAPRILPGG
ncbi:hypothetical protein [Robiginitalea sp. SC105]|uniref:hypothetical protein n=1 Tax=Robiginitalea sp. SC105 TaxID=2762332 RepID=UPI00163B0A35|nr:hypothetical protein [Robiginitalea sp. SC105]MBC2839522.1 hypothetical protein [Robiginitalea sp. SC105]